MTHTGLMPPSIPSSVDKRGRAVCTPTRPNRWTSNPTQHVPCSRLTSEYIGKAHSQEAYVSPKLKEPTKCFSYWRRCKAQQNISLVWKGDSERLISLASRKLHWGGGPVISHLLTYVPFRRTGYIVLSEFCQRRYRFNGQTWRPRGNRNFNVPVD